MTDGGMLPGERDLKGQRGMKSGWNAAGGMRRFELVEEE